MSDNMYIGGDAQISGQVAMGRIVRQEQHTVAASPERDLLDRVAALIDEHAAELPEASRAVRDLADVRQEVDAEDADPERRDNALRRLADRVAPVAAIAEAVRQLADALRPS
ncbi:hypothetical protein [Actinomadura latina]|uniref:DUF4404 family protein n=1 Tax=Actinomadura latina TaxID=163603 RepID=A0A846ZBY6_9ACTN|nr:hypothetical protein [Actinomadura latina]NKZ08015.1 hypothetical protein [Actinomadura latina]